MAEYATNPARVRNRADLEPRLAALTGNWSKDDLLRACEEQGVPAGPINDMAEVFADPQIVARGMAGTVDGVPAVRTPILLSGADLGAGCPAPRLDEHGKAIRQEISRRVR